MKKIGFGLIKNLAKENRTMFRQMSQEQRELAKQEINGEVRQILEKEKTGELTKVEARKQTYVKLQERHNIFAEILEDKPIEITKPPSITDEGGMLA